VRLVAFDVDGTLVENENGWVVWQVLNRRYLGDETINARRFRAYLDGEMSYAEWVRLDIEGWKAGGANRAGIERAIREHLRLTPHSERVLRELKRRGYVLAVVSGTLDIVLEVLLPEHPFSHVYTNRIAFDEAGEIAGWEATPYDMGGKADALRMLAASLGLSPAELAFVGDHVNDRAALELVGFPVLYDPKHEQLEALARHVLPAGRLDLLLDLFPAPP
jgi:phosphoserine phosphatase